MPKKRVYRYNSTEHQFNLDFYQGYDSEFLVKKVRSLMMLVEQHEKFKEMIAENNMTVVGETLLTPESIDDRFLDALRAEVHFTAFHQFECLFALLIAPYQRLPHWLYLTTYKNDELDQKIAAFLDGNISKVTNGKETDTSRFLHMAIYAGMTLSEDHVIAANWQANLENIHWLITQCAEKFAGVEYNAYKHGLRVRAGGSNVTFTPIEKDTLQPVGGPELEFKIFSKDAVTYLELTDKEEDVEHIIYTVQEVHKHFNAYQSLIYMENMARLVRTLVNIRLAALKGDTQANLSIFTDLDQQVS